ncbi:protein insensitive-like [Musca vetustissima]|uniref:protein insensitive-like n=1 Tax=Musca vetustissima TaxID=27455 RepID=UPI002AB69425|nr:protein insensitive-like [Musca vetustissima]
MDTKIISSQIIVRPQQRIPIKVVTACAQNFKRIPEQKYERPLMVNAWSQTTGDDFNFLHELEQKQKSSKREEELLEKIRILEENLKAHTELLSQIHETSARTSALLGGQSNQQIMKPIQIQSIESLQNTKSPLYSIPKVERAAESVASNRNSMQNSTSISPKSVSYTIIAEGSGDGNHEPIEIQLAEDDGALNLNSSADSGRLEICLASDDVDMKTDATHNNNNSHISRTDSMASLNSSTEHNGNRKRKFDAYESGKENQSTNYYFNEQGVLTHSNKKHSISEQTPQKSLLKPIKSENLMASTNDYTNYNTPTQNNISLDNKINKDYVMVSIGPNNTKIPAKVYESMNWSSASIATRKLLMSIFNRETLATHSMTGKPSPAFKGHGKPLKQMLDPLAIQDIIFAVSRKCNVSEKEVRNAITTKCADENKMMKLQMNKRTPMREMNKENIEYK